MYKILTASSDNYITNKSIGNFRTTDANVGSAGTLDLFKLYNESTLSSGSAIATITYTNQPADGNTLNIISTDGTQKTYEFESGGGVTAGNISVAISGDDADATYANLKTAIDGATGHNAGSAGSKIIVEHTDNNNNEGTIKFTQVAEGLEGNTEISGVLANSTIKNFDNGTGSVLGPVELSRILLKFDLSEVVSINQNKCPVDHPSFNATLKLFDIYGGQTTPSNFSVRVYPLSQSFDEGIGRDIVRYSDLGSSNFVTASLSDGEINKWNVPGANKKGVLKKENLDIIETGTFDASEGSVNLYVDQTFSTGKENLEIDVTKIVSGTVKQLIPDCGFRVSFTPTIENNQKTYFVKRFASRNAADPTMRPQLIIKYNDTIHDHHKGMNFNVSGSLFLNNFVNGEYKNILSGSTSSPGTLEEISGNDCLLVKIFTGSYEKYVSGSSYSIGSINYEGIYSASFLIDKFDSNLIDHVNTSGSIDFTTVWTDTEQLTVYHSGSFSISNNNTTTFNNSTNRLIASITNLRKTYYKKSIARFRVFVENVDKVVRYVKIPKEKSSEVFYNMRYAIVDVDTGKYIVPFQKSNNSTLLSVDSEGMYFDLDMNSLPSKRIYKIVFLLNDKNEERIIENTASVFRVI